MSGADYIAGGRNNAVKEIIAAVFGREVTSEEFEKATALLPPLEIKNANPVSLAVYYCKFALPLVLKVERPSQGTIDAAIRAVQVKHAND